ncbi:MAG: hypothetical protein AB7S41_01660 [Parvibaculaceae bacterium]
MRVLRLRKKIDPVTWPIVDPKLADAVEKLCIAKETGLNANDALGNALSSTNARQPFHPSFELECLANLEYHL